MALPPAGGNSQGKPLINTTCMDKSIHLMTSLTMFGTVVGLGLGIESGIALGREAYFQLGTFIDPILGTIPAAVVGITAGAVASVALGGLGAVVGALCSLLSTVILYILLIVKILLIVAAAICSQKWEALLPLNFEHIFNFNT